MKLENVITLFINTVFNDGLRKIIIAHSATNNGLTLKHFEEIIFTIYQSINIYLINEFLVFLIFFIFKLSHNRLQWSSGDPIEHISF